MTVINLGKPQEALLRAEKLKRIYTRTQLREGIQEIPRCSYEEQLQRWTVSNERRKLGVAYRLNCQETKKLLLELNVSHGALTACYSMDNDAIEGYLLQSGIKSKALRRKIMSVIMELKK